MRTFPHLSIEILEARIAPATLTLTEGGLVYQAGNNVANDLTFDIVGTNIVITDNAETINVAQAQGFVLSNGNKTATGPAASVAVVSLSMGNLANSVKVFATDDQLGISSTGALAVTVGDGSVKQIKNLVSIDDAPGGTDSLLVDGGTDGAAVVTVVAGGVGGPGDTFLGANGQISAAGVETITVRTGVVASTVKVKSTAAGTTTNITSAGTDVDTVIVGDLGNMQGIAGAVAFTNPFGFSNLTFDNSADTAARAVTITATSVTGLAPAALTFINGDVNGLAVLGGTGADTFTVTGMQTPTGGFSNTIDAGGGDDTVNIATATSAATFLGGTGADTFNLGNAGSLSGITASMTVQGGGEAGDALVLNDGAVVANDAYTITGTTIDRATFGTLTYSGFPAVTLNAEAGNNDIEITGAAAGTLLTINANGGNDTIALGVGAGTLDAFLGQVAVHGDAGTSDALVLNDSSEQTNHTYAVIGNAVLRDGITLVTTSSTVEALTVLAGFADDTMNARNADRGVIFGGSAGVDGFTGSAFSDAFLGGLGTDTFTSLGIAGNATVATSGVTYPGGNNDTFPFTEVEVVRIGGDAGINNFDATAFSGFALLDGVSGKDIITGSDVLFAAKSVTLKDGDGDTVTIKSTKARIGVEHLDFALAANGTGVNLQTLDLLGNQAFKGATISFTAKASATAGDSFVNVGFIDATGIDLAGVTIAGDLGRIVAGDATTATPGLGKLTVGSLYGFGAFTQAAGGSNASFITGKLGALTVKTNFRAGNLDVSGDGTAANGAIGAVKIGGNFSGTLGASGNIASVVVSKAMLGGILLSGTTIGAVKIAGDFTGTIAAGFVNFTPTTQAKSVVLKSLTVGGDVIDSNIFAGGVNLNSVFNADASIGTISVTGDWIRSSVSAGTSAMNALLGDAGDTVGVGVGGTFNNVAGGNPAIVATIASITVKGQVAGTFAGQNAADHYGFVAQQIGAFKVGTAKLKLTKNATDAPIELGPTGDITVREVA